MNLVCQEEQALIHSARQFLQQQNHHQDNNNLHHMIAMYVKLGHTPKQFTYHPTATTITKNTIPCNRLLLARLEYYRIHKSLIIMIIVMIIFLYIH